MPSLRDIRRRIRSVRNTAQITKAMELVAASRMRRAQQRVLASRPYAGAIRTMMAQLAAARREGEVLHPLLQQRPVRRMGLVLITTDRGLCGPLNSNVIRRAGEFLLQAEQPVELVTVDVSFISVTKLLPALVSLARPGTEFLILVKPQFELERGAVGRGGIVREPELQARAIERVRRAAEAAGLEVCGVVPSRLAGAEGNQEFFLRARRKPADSR